MSDRKMIEIRLHPNLSELIGSPGKISVGGETPRDCLMAAVVQYSALGKILWRPRNQINQAVLLFLNDEHIHETDLERKLKPGDQIDIIPAIVGG